MISEYFPSDYVFREVHHNCIKCPDGKMWLSDDKQSDECDRCGWQMPMMFVARRKSSQARHVDDPMIG